MNLTEIFSSIQGESTHAGRPCTFVRTTGCDQRCSWCDTAYAFEGGESLSVAEVLARVNQLGLNLVEVTGGEPLLQDDMPQLLTTLCNQGYEVLLETGGSLSIEGVDPRVTCILDLKAPASGMSDRILWDNLAHLKGRDEVKFVLADRGDYDWACRVIDTHELAPRALLSPVFELLDPALLAEWMVADRRSLRMQMQLHKLIWSPERRGV